MGFLIVRVTQHYNREMGSRWIGIYWFSLGADLMKNIIVSSIVPVFIGEHSKRSHFMATTILFKYST